MGARANADRLARSLAKLREAGTIAVASEEITLIDSPSKGSAE